MRPTRVKTESTWSISSSRCKTSHSFVFLNLPVDHTISLKSFSGTKLTKTSDKARISVIRCDSYEKQNTTIKLYGQLIIHNTNGTIDNKLQTISEKVLVRFLA